MLGEIKLKVGDHQWVKYRMLSKNMTWRVGSVIRCDNVMINLSRWSSSVPLALDANSVCVMTIWVVVVWAIKAFWLQGP